MMLAWRPFLDPMDLHAYWWAFLVPLALLISVVYKAVRVERMADWPRATIVMTAQIILSMILLGAGVFCFLEYILPMIAPR
jgi:nitric oxide reductase large subunit